MASSSLLLQSPSERDYILAGCRDNCRSDGRTRHEFRSYTIVAGHEPVMQTTTTSPSPSPMQMMYPPSSSSSSSSSSEPLLALSSGSARLMSSGGGGGETHMLCSVKAELVRPAPDRPNQGVIEVHVETLAANNPQERRAAEALAATLRRLVLTAEGGGGGSSGQQGGWLDNGGGALLCIAPGRCVWRLHADIMLLSSPGAGAAVDAASRVLRAALQNTLLPAVTVAAQSPLSSSSTATEGVEAAASSPPLADLHVDGDLQKARPPPGADAAPTVVTVAVLKCPATVEEGGSNHHHRHQPPRTVLVVDPTAEEEACAAALVHVATTTMPTTNNNANDNNAALPSVTAIHKSLPGSLPLDLLPQIMATAAEAAATAAPRAYRIVQYQQQQHDNTTTTSASSNHAATLLQENYALKAWK